MTVTISQAERDLSKIVFTVRQLAEQINATPIILTPANPTHLVGLTPIGGSAGSTYMRSDAAPALDQSISPTWTGIHIFTPPSPSDAQVTAATPAFSIVNNSNITGTSPSNNGFGYAYNLIEILSEELSAASSFVPTSALQIIMGTGGTHSGGSKNALNIQLYHNIASNQSTIGDHVAEVVEAIATTNAGGTGIHPSTAKGTLFALSPVCGLESGATNWWSISGAEVDVGILTGSSVNHRFGWEVIDTGNLPAFNYDFAYLVTATASVGAPGFKCGYASTSQGGKGGIATNGMFAGIPDMTTQTFAQGFDFYFANIAAVTGSFTGVISGTLLTASAVTGSITIGAVVSGAGVTAGTRVLYQITGSTAGGAGTYQLTVGSSVGSEAMTCSYGGNFITGPSGNFNVDNVGRTLTTKLIAHDPSYTPVAAITPGDICAVRALGNTGAYFFGDTTSQFLFFDGTNFQFSGGGFKGSPQMFTANGAVAVSLTNVAPTGAHATVQKWFTVVDNAGATFYIPAF